MSRQAIKQYTDQGISGLNLSTYDPSIGGQMTNAGIQAVRGLFSRKIRAVSVGVPSGYQVLLKDTRTAGAGRIEIIRDTAGAGVVLSGKKELIEPPTVDSLEPFLRESVSEGQLGLDLRGIYQIDDVQWLYLAVRNNSAVSFSPAYIWCNIRQGKHLKRMAMQELPVDLLYDSLPGAVGSGESKRFLVALPSFIPSKDKQLVIKLGEGNGGRSLQLSVHHKIWNKIKPSL